MAIPNFTDGDFSRPVPISNAGKAYPFRKYGDTTHAVYSRDYMQALASLAPSAISAVDPLESGFYLTEETPPESKQGALCTFTRTYSNVPKTRVSYSTGTFTRPALPVAAVETTYGSEASGNSGMYRFVASGVYEMFSRRAVSSDDGVSSDPTGGTYTVTVPNLGTTTAIAYDADAAAVQTALRAISGYSSANMDLRAVVSADPGYDTAVYSSVIPPSAAAVAGSGMVLSKRIDGATYATVPQVKRATLSFHNAVFVPVLDLTAGGNDRTSTVLWLGNDVRSVSAGDDPWDTSSFSDQAGLILKMPCYWTIRSRHDNTQYEDKYLGERSAVVSGYIRVTCDSTSVDVALPTGDPHAWSAATISAFGAAIAEASVEAMGGGSARCAQGRIEQRAEQPAMPYPVNPLYSPNITQDRLTFDDYTAGTNSVYPDAPSVWSMSIGWGAEFVPVTASTTSASLEAAMNAMATAVARGLTFTANVIQHAYGCIVSFSAYYYRPPTFASSLTPAPSSIQSWGTIPTHYALRATVTERNIVTQYPHGLTGTELLYVKQGTTYTYSVSGYRVVSPTQIAVSNEVAPFNSANTVSELGAFMMKYQAGGSTAVLRETVDYWLPGVSSGISTPADIPVYTTDPTDDDILGGIFSTSDGFIRCGASELSEYLGAIWQRKNVEVKIR